MMVNDLIALNLVRALHGLADSASCAARQVLRTKFDTLTRLNFLGFSVTRRHLLIGHGHEILLVLAFSGTLVR